MENIKSGPLKNLLICLFVLGTVGLVTLLRVGMSGLVGTSVPLMLFLLPVMISSLLFGFWPGMLATFTSVLSSAHFFMSSHGDNYISRLCVFIGVGLVCSTICSKTRNKSLKIKVLLSESLRSADNERVLREELERKDEDKAAILESLEQTNAQLEKSHDRFERVALAANIGIWSWCSDSNLITSSAACNELLGVPKGETVTTKRFLNCIHHDDRAVVCEAVNLSLSEHKYFDVEFRSVAPENAYCKWVRAAGWIDQSHGASRLYGITLDITAHKRAIEEIQAARAAAERASDAKSRFLAQMSHEIRSPMNAILGFTQILLEESAHRSPEDVSSLSRIKVHGDHLMHIINDILDLSTFETGKIAVEQSVFSPIDLVNDVILSFAPSADQKQLSLEFYPTPKVPDKIVSDPFRLRQVLFNLIGNAIKFTEAGSVKVNLDYAQGFLHFKVSDTGVGLSEDQIKRLFQPFEQADTSNNRKFGGTGLGLVLSRHLAQALGGDLTLYSGGNGEGCSFSFTISTGAGEKQYPLSAETVIAKNSNFDLNELKILLAEDSPDGAAIVTRLLTRAKATVKIASSGYEVLEQTRLHDFDIILMDVQMPGMDGLEATRILRRSGYDKPIVALTAHALPEEKEKSTRAGCDAHLTKPVDKNTLLHAIQQHTQARDTSKKINS